MWNPWRVKCPRCSAKLEMSLLVKTFFALIPLLGAMYGGVPIFMEETGRWSADTSAIYFAFTAPALVGLSYVLWPRTKLLLRRPQS